VQKEIDNLKLLIKSFKVGLGVVDLSKFMEGRSQKFNLGWTSFNRDGARNLILEAPNCESICVFFIHIYN
jgi:hypothetical protein